MSPKEVPTMRRSNSKISVIALVVVLLTAITPSIASDGHPAQRTVIIIPGIMGSVLRDARNGRLLWLNMATLMTSRCSNFLLSLTLASDGSTPANQIPLRCTDDGRSTITGAPVKVDGLLAGGLRELIPNFYRDLVRTLQSDFNTVPFPYDWRLDYETIAVQLRKRIEENTRNNTTVDIVAHSQGGLVVRTYLARYGADPRLGKVIFLGTPQLGAPKSFAILSGWQSLEHYYGPVVDGLNFRTGSFVSNTFPASYELLPRFDFVTVDGKLTTTGSTFTQLSNQGLLQRAKSVWQMLKQPTPQGVRLFAINGSGRNTLEGLSENTQNNCILPINDPKGDGTVPSKSSGGLGQVEQIYVNVEHADLPNSEVVRKTVLEILKRGIPSGLALDKTRSATPFANDHVVANTCGPVRFNVNDGKGLLTGFRDGKILTQILDSQFFRFAENDAAILPVGQFVVTLEGTGEGNASFTAQLFSAESEPKLCISFPELHVTKKFSGVLLMDFNKPVLLVDREGNETFEEQVQPAGRCDPLQRGSLVPVANSSPAASK
jgi:pimeloyl-ACP methyl ester carboxylesterase